MAATKHWASAGDMEADGFSSGSDDAVLRGDLTFGTTNVSLSVVDGETRAAVAAVAGTTDAFAGSTGGEQQVAIGVSGTAGSFKYAFGHQQETDAGYNNPNGDFNKAEVTGVSVGFTFGSADITLAHARSKLGTTEKDSTGLKVGYSFGDVKVTAYFVSEGDNSGTDPKDNYGLNVAYASGPLAVALDYQDDQGSKFLGVEGSYDLGNGMKIFAGAIDNDRLGSTNMDGTDAYVGLTYDLGGGASALFSYASNGDKDDDGDEIGAPDYKEGLTVEVSFKF